MKKIQIIIFICITMIAFLAILIEVINPHSFLNYTGAFYRSAGILLLLPLWIWLSNRGAKHLKILGILLLLATSLAYLLYGLSVQRANSLYEKQRAFDQEKQK